VIAFVLKAAAKILLFAVLCFCVIEFSYRLYSAGLTAFDPVRFNSLNVILNSGLVEASENPNLTFELRPNLDTWFQGIPFRTNSDRMADREYTLEKPADTLRIGVIGSSWTMATGVEQEDTYHAIMESALQGNPERTTNYEFLNFAVEYYGLRELVATARYRANKYEPDALIVAVTSFTSWVRWEEPEGVVEMPERTYPFFQSYSIRGLERSLNARWFKRGFEIRPLLENGDIATQKMQLTRFVDEFHQISVEQGIPVVIIWLAYGRPGVDIVELMESRSREKGIVFVRGYEALAGTTNELKKLWRARFDKHPNRQGHSLIAQKLGDAMFDAGLIPDRLKLETAQ
jgi:hypothetical protein